MYDLLTEAIEPSILAEESNFKLIPLYNTSLLQRDFLVETTHKLFETTVAHSSLAWMKWYCRNQQLPVLSKDSAYLGAATA